MSSAYEYASIPSVPAGMTKRASWAPTYLNDYAESLDRGAYSPSVDDLFYNPIRFKRAMKNAVRSWQLQRPSGPLNVPQY
ncbi:hypothetical protein AAVH_11687 [Aphelenchoides avenae]|nr:hypothetical protein AAVH_11687 [Aphelenchus avenae]